VLVTNRFRLEQKSYLPLKLQFMSRFGKTTIFNVLLGNRPDVFFWASDYLIWSSFWSPIIKIVNFHGRSGKLWTIKRILSTYNVCDLVSSTVRKFIHSICCKMYMYEFHFTVSHFVEITNGAVILCYIIINFSCYFLICKQKFWFPHFRHWY
jgi:hypothetical protein